MVIFSSAPTCVGSCSMSRAFRPCGLLFYLLFDGDRFHGIDLNQNAVLQQIGHDGKEGTPWNRLFKISTGGMIITALGFVPGKNSHL